MFRPQQVAVIRLAVMVAALMTLSGCAAIVSSATSRFADSLTAGILNQDDPKTVADGAPAYLILVDGAIDGNPKDASLLLAGSKLYGAYASVFVADRERRLRMTEKAVDYADRALCLRREAGCGLRGRNYDEFVTALAAFHESDVPALYTFAVAWAGWIETRSSDWSAVADLAKVRAALERVVVLEEGFDGGGAHLYLGALASLIPPAAGGRPEVARQHFERALALSDGHNLMVKVQYAERYARLTYDRELHDRLLQETLAAEYRVRGYTLVNVLARQRARELLDSAKDYF
jgi:hypothetical protein